jgi:hypothetical protein
MLAGLGETNVRVGAGEYETELTMCPIAVAVRYAEANGDVPEEWNPEWGTRVEFGRRIVDFVDAFDTCAETEGLDSTLRELRRALSRLVVAGRDPAKPARARRSCHPRGISTRPVPSVLKVVRS